MKPIRDAMVIKTIKSLLRVARMSRYPAKLSTTPLQRNVAFVFGNGPSLSMDLQNVSELYHLGDVFCVNQFAESELYEKTKPKYYIFADLAWASPTIKNMVAMRERLVDIIINKTSWDLTIFLPFIGSEVLAKAFAVAPKIRLVYYNHVPLWGSKRIINKLYDLGWGMVAAQTVLVAALFLSLRLGYKKIILLGADHSWHETLTLDDKNRVCLRDRHCYDNDAELKPFTFDGSDENIFTIAELFLALSRMFEGYLEIEAYSKYHGAQVYNASSTTYIDAFERRNLNDILKELSGCNYITI